MIVPPDQLVRPMMHVIGGGPIWVVCVFRCIDVVCCRLLCTQFLNAVFCVICSVLMIVSHASGDHMVETRGWVLLWFCMLRL